MKKHSLALAFTCSLLLLASCSKPGHPHLPLPWPSHFMVQELQHGNRSYTFHYNKMGLVDSIAVSGLHEQPYVYRVARHRQKIDSVSLVQNGTVISTNGDIRYDHAGRITGYTYYLRAIYQPYPAVSTLAYGPSGDITTIARVAGSVTDHDTLAFDQHHNLLQWRQHQLNSAAVSTFTYDTGNNPLYYINGLFLMFVEEPFFREFIFSRHNSTGKVRRYASTTETSSYHNEYDTYHRLTRKVMERSSGQADSLIFRYLH